MEIKLSEQIKKYRAQKGITQEELANTLKVTNQAVSKWESGQCYPDITLLPKLALFFGISLDELMVGERLQKAKTYPAESIAAALEILEEFGCLYTALLQKMLCIGYRRSKSIITELESKGYIIKSEGYKYKSAK